MMCECTAYCFSFTKISKYASARALLFGYFILFLNETRYNQRYFSQKVQTEQQIRTDYCNSCLVIGDCIRLFSNFLVKDIIYGKLGPLGF